MSRIAIIGCGYVGGALAQRLAAQGHEVWGIRRSQVDGQHGVRCLQADVLQPETLRLPDALDHVVYAVSAGASTEEAYRAAYVAGLSHVLSALKPQSARVLFVSSTGVFHQDNGEWLDETSPAEPRSFSGRVLLEAEALLTESRRPATTVRFSGIYGPGRTRLIESVRNGTARRAKEGTAVLNHIHRDDCAGALEHILAMEKPADLYLGTDSEPVYKNDALCWIAEQLGMPHPPEVEELPAAGPHRGGHRFYKNQRLLDSGYVFHYPTYREGYGKLLH